MNYRLSQPEISEEEIIKAPILEYIQESADNFKNGIKFQPLKIKKDYISMQF